MLLVGLTGNIASGKSSVAEFFQEKGATVIDADALAREAVAKGTPGLEAVVKRWGNTVLAPDGTLDRAAMRRIVFADSAEREALNAIVHPRVEELRVAQVEAARAHGAKIVVCDIPLLYEKDMGASFDVVVLVDAPRGLRHQRLVRERGLDHAEADAMIDAQMPSDTKRTMADYVIDNTNGLRDLQDRTADVWRSLTRDAERKDPR